MKRYISGPTRAAFPLAIIVVGVTFLVVSFVIMDQNALIGLSMAVLSTLILVARTGYEIDTEKKLARQFTSILGIKSGKWTDITQYAEVSLLSTRMNTTAYSRSNRSTSDHYLLFRVCLLDDTHLRKIVVYESKSKLRAEAFLKDLTDGMAVKHVRYSPKKLRRRNRR